MEVLVTGGTGTLGRATVPLLIAADHDVRVLSRRSGPGLTTGDLERRQGLKRALDGVHTVLHLATSVSYTHLDVYKRQMSTLTRSATWSPSAS